MRKLLLALPLLLFWACSQKDVVKIEGTIQNIEGKTLYLDHLQTSKALTVDSVVIGKKGTFKFKVETTQPEFYMLRLANGKLITLLAEPNEEIDLLIAGDKMSKAYSVEGSKGSKLVQKLNSQLRKTKESLASIKTDLEEKKADPNYSTISQNLLAKYVETLQGQRKFSIDFIMENATSLSSYMALYQKLDDKNFTLNENDDIQFVKIVASSMKALYPEHEYTKAILGNLKTLENRLSNIKMSQLIKQAGSEFPDITLPNTKGKDVSLSSLNGKFIVLSYWASQNPNSRKHNRTLNKVYKKYKNRGLEIYQISLDQDEKQWKKAIEEDQMNWINVCDLETGSLSAVRLYNIQQIPANYLIDQRGEIVGKNLYGLALEEKIAEYVK